LRAAYRAGMPGRAPFLDAWAPLERGVAEFYHGRLGCC